MKHEGAVSGALLTKDETRILSWSEDKTLRIWDAATGKQFGPAITLENAVKGALLTKNETRILSWSEQPSSRFDTPHGTLRLWDITSGKQIGRSMEHDGPIHGTLFNADERRILSWSEDGTVRQWDAATGQQIGPAMKHDRLVWGALLTKDERRILSWSSDQTLDETRRKSCGRSSNQ
jgi:WD40 repeat protein